MMKITALKIQDIKIGERLRALDEDWVKALAVLIKEDGLKHPVEVFAEDDGYRLVAGHHRLKACKLMGRETIECILLDAKSKTQAADIRIAEISENLFRQELDALSRAGHLAELKQAYEDKFPWLKHGGDRRSRGKQAIENKGGFQVAKMSTLNDDDGVLPEFVGKNDMERLAIWSDTRFTTDVAEKIGLSERSIRRSVKIWRDILPSVRELLGGTVHAKKQSDLLDLAMLDAKQQGAVCDLLFCVPAQAASLKEAIEIASNRVPFHKPGDYDRTIGYFLRLNKKDKRSFLTRIEKDIKEYAREKGWLE